MTRKVLAYRFIKLFLIIPTFFLILSSCDIIDAIADVFNGEDEDNDIIISSTTVGTDGGVIKSDELTLTIPAGAFSQSADINIYSSSFTDGSIDDIATKVYKIEGLPDQYSKPIDVSIKHNGNISEQSYLVVQEESYIPSLDSINASNIYFEAVISGDSIKSQIPTIITGTAKVGSANRELNLTSSTAGFSFKLFGISNIETHTTAGNNFKIIYNTSKDNATDIIVLGQYLEDAYSKIQGLGFSYARRTKWPVTVLIEDLANNVYGLHCPSRWGLNSYYLKFNRINLNKQVEMKTTAIHEFFHLVQYLYDNRNFLSRATFKPPHHWFNEACSVWSEKLVTNSGYISDVRTSNTLIKPFTGLQAGSVSDATFHGYGMSAFIKYIEKKYGGNVLVSIYEKIFAGRHVVDAINNSINHNLFMDYNPFLREYTQGKIYTDISHDIIVNNRDDTFKIETEKDTLKTFTANYKDLSAKLYLVSLNYKNFKDDATLEISIDQDLCDITVFQYPKLGGAVTELTKGLKNCVVSDLKGLMQQEKRLIVMVTNSNYISNNYTPSNKDINVKMEVKNTKIVGAEIEIVVDNITLRYNDKTNSGSGGWVTTTGQGYSWWFSSGIYGFSADMGTGSLNNNVYSATFDNTFPDEQTISGNMRITFLDDPRRVNVHIDRVRTAPGWPTGIVTERTNIDYVDVPLTTTNSFATERWDIYKVSGSAVSKISISYSSVSDTYDEEYVSHGTCSADAYIEIRVKYE
jgi:hypothetical protein